MTNRWPDLALAAALLMAGVTPAAAQKCSTVRVDQESYGAVSDLIYVYAPNINKADGGWRPFKVRVLVGQYRRPLLLKRGFMREADVDKLLAEHRDIAQYQLQVAGYNPRTARGTKPAPTQPVSFKDDGRSMTTRVVQVNLAAAVSLGSDHVMVEVCRQ